MLQRLTAATFQAPAGQKIRLIIRSSKNNGVNSGAFHFAGSPLLPEGICGFPGCSFFVPAVDVTQQFRVHVDFDPSASDARYDLFEVDPIATCSLLDLNERRLASDPDGIIGFGIVGVAAADEAVGLAGDVVAAPPPPPPPPPAPKKPKKPKKKTTTTKKAPKVKQVRQKKKKKKKTTTSVAKKAGTARKVTPRTKAVRRKRKTGRTNK